MRDQLPGVGEVWKLTTSSWYLRKFLDIPGLGPAYYDYTKAPGKMFHPDTTILIVRTLPALYPHNQYLVCLIDEELYCIPDGFFAEWEKVLESAIKDNEYPLY